MSGARPCEQVEGNKAEKCCQGAPTPPVRHRGQPPEIAQTLGQKEFSTRSSYVETSSPARLKIQTEAGVYGLNWKSNKSGFLLGDRGGGKSVYTSSVFSRGSVRRVPLHKRSRRRTYPNQRPRPTPACGTVRAEEGSSHTNPMQSTGKSHTTTGYRYGVSGSETRAVHVCSRVQS